MPCINFPIDPKLGPVVEIGISVSTKDLLVTSPAPPIHWIKAVADSGCERTSIQSLIIQKIGLRQRSKVPQHSAQGQIVVDAFRGDLFIRTALANNPAQIVEESFRDLLFPEITCPLPNFGALLGMDVLGFGQFTVNGPAKLATFCW